MRSIKSLSIAVFLLLNCASDVAAAEIHVATNGKDDNDGSAIAPVATLQRAQALARKAGQSTVVLHEGTWFLAEPLVFYG
jgi:hypothetical protein